MNAMIDGMPSMNACGCLSQLEVCKLLQCGDQVVCPGGLNGQLEPMQFTFPEPLSGMWPPPANPPVSHHHYR